MEFKYFLQGISVVVPMDIARAISGKFQRSLEEAFSPPRREEACGLNGIP